MTTGSVASVPRYQQLVPPENVGTGGYQSLPSQNSGAAVVSRQPINTATNAGSGARMATTPVAVQNGNLPPPAAPVQTAAVTRPTSPSATYSQQQASVGAPSNLPSRTQDVATKRVMIRSGETLSAFAKRNGASEQDILRLNGLTSASQVRAGQVLVVPLVSPQSSAAKATAQTQGLPPASPVPSPSDKPSQRVAVLPSTAGTRERQSSGSSTGATAPTAAGQSGDGRNTASGSLYTVKSGDSLYTIAKASGVTVDSLKAANGLTSSNIRIGQKLQIPSAGAAPAQPVAPVQTANVQKQQPTSASSTASASEKPKPYQPPAVEEKVEVEEVAVRTDAAEDVPQGTGITAYRWPVNGAVVVGYGQADGDEISEGIDISVPQGTPIKAAENGVVVYADDGLSDYGNAILIRHEDGRVTVYGYADELKVKRGDSVQRGQTIATSGMTGKAQRPMVHFEVRDNTRAVDPMPYLKS